MPQIWGRSKRKPRLIPLLLLHGEVCFSALGFPHFAEYGKERDKTLSRAAVKFQWPLLKCPASHSPATVLLAWSVMNCFCVTEKVLWRGVCKAACSLPPMLSFSGCTMKQSFKEFIKIARDTTFFYVCICNRC